MSVSEKGAARRRNAAVLSIAAGAAAAMLGVAAQSASAANPPPPDEVHDQFFDWFVNATPSYLPSPFLTDSSANAVNAFLASRPAGSPLAVKVERPISNATANLIFNNPNYHVSYVLGDIETNTIPNVTTLVKQVRYVNGNNGQKTNSFNAYIGEYGINRLTSDVTDPANYNSQSGTHSFSGYGLGQYNSTGVNMSMPELYGGSGSYRNPAAGNSNAPNIRSAMFVLPALRVSQIAVNNPEDERIVPYVARFNNFGNLALDSDRNASNGYKFVPGQAMPAAFGLPAVSAADTANQMLSRRDFATQVLHYRLRGANSYVLFEPGVDGYFQDQKRSDAKTGFTEPHVDAIFNAADYKLVLGADSDYKNGNNSKDFNGNIIEDGKMMSDEQAGAMFSGVYSLSLKRLDMLLSNQDDADHSLTLPSKIAGFDLKTKTFDLDAGTSLLVEYKLSTSGLNKGWSVALQNVPFVAIENSRNHFGIPEPGTISLAAAMGFIGIARRRRPGQKDGEAKPFAPLASQHRAPLGLIGMNMSDDVYVLA